MWIVRSKSALQQIKEWQKYIEELLVLHYGPEDFQRIPDECRGDLGVEAFTRSGNGIQCYAPQGRLTIKQRYEKHRIELSADISKPMQNQDGLRAVLGQTVLKRWVFIIEVKVLPHGADAILGYEAISQWLTQCNLDFLEGGDA